MSFLPPVVLEIRAQAAQLYAETAKVADAVKAMADESGAAATGMGEKVTASTESMAAKVASATMEMAAGAAARAEEMAKTVVDESKQMDIGTVAAVEHMTAAVLASFDSMAGDMTAAMELTAEHTSAAMKASSEEIIQSNLLTAQTVEETSLKIIEALTEEGAAATRTAEETKAAGISMGKTFAETAAAAVSASGTMSSALTASFMKQAEAAKGAQLSIMGFADGLGKIAIATGVVVAGVGLDLAAKFQKSTNLLVTAGGEAKDQLDTVRAGILQISNDTGTSAENLSDGMYIMEKAGYRGAAGLAALRASAEGAKAENVDLGTMTQATTDILLDYGYKMDTAAHATQSSVSVVNQLVAASGAAKVTMRDFAASMAAVVPIASAAHISFQEVGGALATMTQHGQTAAQSSQNLANLIQSLIRPNNMASNAMQQFGIDTVGLAQHLGDAGLSGSLQMIHDKIIQHMGPDGMVVQDTMKKSASATDDLRKMLAQMPPELSNLSQGLMQGTEDQKAYLAESKSLGGHAGALADQFLSLYKSSQGVNDAMRQGQPAMMTYQAAMTKVLGNVTAARAATMLLMNNSQDLQRSIALVAKAAQESGQHIATWADTQQTLSVQLDMAKQRSENLAIELGTKLIPVANGALQGFEGLIDAFEKGNPLAMGFAAVLGGAATLAVANFAIKMGKAGVSVIMDLAKMGMSAKIMAGDFLAGFNTAGTAAEVNATKMSKFGAAVGNNLPLLGGLGAGLGVAFVGLQVLSGFTKNATVDTDQLTKALADLGTESSAAKGVTELNNQFSNWSSNVGVGIVNVNTLDGAITKMTQDQGDGYSVFNNMFDGLRQSMGFAKSDLGQFQDRFKAVGDQMGQMVKGGNLEIAAESFDKLATKFEANGKSAQDALDAMPGYKQALIDTAAASGVTLSSQETLDMAMGKLPQKMVDAAAANSTYTDSQGNVRQLTDQVKKSLDDLGVSIDGEITDLGKLYDAMIKTGMANLSARDATFHFQDQITQADQKAQDMAAKLGGNLSSALDKTGKDFSTTTEAGQAAEAAFSGVTQAGLNNASVMAHDTTKGLSDVTGALKSTYDGMVGTAEKFGLNSQAAEDLTRKVLNIPPGVNINSWMSDYAKKMAEQTKGALDNIPKNTTVTVSYETYKTEFDKVVGLPGTQVPSSIAKPGAYTGGYVQQIMGMYDGGVVPGRAPSNPHQDNILAAVNGKPLAVRSGEYIVNEQQTKANLPLLHAINRGHGPIQTNAPRLAYAGGGGGSTSNVTNNNDNSRTVNANVSISSTADAASLAGEFNRMISNM